MRETNRREMGAEVRERTRLTGILLAAMAAGYAGGLISQANTKAAPANTAPATSEVPRAKRFEVIDSAGKLRGVFATLKGEPALELVDSAGKLRGVFATIKGETALELADLARQGVKCSNMYVVSLRLRWLTQKI